jgi:hypothetical protein
VGKLFLAGDTSQKIREETVVVVVVANIKKKVIVSELVRIGGGGGLCSLYKKWGRETAKYAAK